MIEAISGVSFPDCNSAPFSFPRSCLGTRSGCIISERDRLIAPRAGGVNPLSLGGFRRLHPPYGLRRGCFNAAFPGDPIAGPTIAKDQRAGLFVGSTLACVTLSASEPDHGLKE